MKKYAILTDSTSTIPNGTEINGIKVYTIPLYIYVNDVEYKENETITIEDISKYIADGTKFKSSQPSTIDFLDFYKKMYDDGVTHCIAIHCSSGMSGTYQNSIIASKMNESTGIETFLFDSRLGAYPIEKMVRTTATILQEQKDKKSFECITKELNEILLKLRKETVLVVIPSNLKQLAKSGRANTAQVLTTTLLNIKLILQFDEEGKFTVKEKVRSDKKVKKYMESLIEDAISLNKEEFGFLYTNNQEECKLLANEYKEKYPQIRFFVKQMVPVVAIYAGNGTIALTY